MSEAYNSKSQSIYSIKVQKSLYGLKQFRRMWYNRLNEYLLKEGFENNQFVHTFSLRNQNLD
jgi:ribosomal protein L20